MEEWRRRANPNIVVQAVRLTEDNASEVAEWCGATLIEEIDPEFPDETQPGLNVPCPNGMQRASLGMYVYKIAKHVFVMHNRPFEIMHEPVGRPAPPLESAGDSRKARGFADPFDRGRMT